MSDRVGSESARPNIDAARDDSAQLKVFEVALRSAAKPQGAGPNAGANPGGDTAGAASANMSAASAGAQPVNAAHRDTGTARAARTVTPESGRPTQSSHVGSSKAPVEGAQESASGANANGATARPDAKAKHAVTGGQVNSGAHAAGAAKPRNSDIGANDREAETAMLALSDIADPGQPVAPVQPREPQPDTSEAAPGQAEKAAVIETLQGLADGSLTAGVKSRLLAENDAKIASGADAAETNATTTAVIDILDNLSTLASDVLANSPYENLDFVTLFDELFWIRNWLALFGDPSQGGEPIDFEQSVDYSVNSAVSIAMQLDFTRALIEPLKPTEWDRFPVASLRREDPVDGPGAEAAVNDARVRDANATLTS